MSNGSSSDFAGCATCTLRDNPLCEGSRRDGRTLLGSISRRRSVVTGEMIMAQGAPASVVGLVVAGVVRLVKTLPDGREQIVDLCCPGEFFGSPLSQVADCSVEAATDAQLCVMDRAAFAAIMARYPDLEHALLKVTLDELAVARARNLILGCLTSQERIASYLLIALQRREHVLASVAGPLNKRLSVLQISRRDLARYLSTSVETISRTLHQFARLGVIRLINYDHFEITDEEELLSLSGHTVEDLATFAPQSRAARSPDNGSIQSDVRGNVRLDGGQRSVSATRLGGMRPVGCACFP